MTKLLDFLHEKLLPWLVVFLLFFIPLYPKLPLLGVTHTWVYIRLEDVLISLAVGIWFLSLIRGKLKLPNVIAKPVIFYWVVGFVSTAIALLFIFPNLANVFPNVAIFHYLRRIEYLILLFAACSTIKKGSDINKFIAASALAMFGVILYGFSQKFLGMPAFLTMNEEFAKGVPLYLPPGARITSTFGGHYDLAAFLVLEIALLGSLFFGVKKVLTKAFFLLLTIGGLSVLLLTASRVSFAVYLITISFMLTLQKKKILIIPVVIFSLFLLVQVRGTAERFAKTFRIQPIVINTRTGQPIAVLEKLPPEISGIKPTPPPPQETLPLGTGFIALPPVSGPEPEATSIAVIRRPVSSSLKLATVSSEISTISGSFLIQKAFVYDISFTTRFQGEWPRAWEAFRKNPLTGTGYSSITLATDNDYLRSLGETGILGFLSFFFIFLTFFILVKKTLPKITNHLDRSFVIGISAGLIGLALNAILIDVFEASKVAFIFWLVLGLAIGIIGLYEKEKINLVRETLKFLTSQGALYFYLFLVTLIGYGKIFNNYFTGDDFVWLKWAAQSKIGDLIGNFYMADGFFYRPLVKILYFAIYAIFWLKPLGYHLVSIFGYFLSGCLIYKIALKMGQSKYASILAAALFLMLPINTESVVWVSAYSALLMSLFTLSAFYNFLTYEESGKKTSLFLMVIFFIFALLSHEAGVILPFLVIWYEMAKNKFGLSDFLKKRSKLLIFFVLILSFYIYIRNLAHAHGFSGDYNYNISHLPYNVFGNLIGYFSISLLGLWVLPFYNFLRQHLREQIGVAFGALVFLSALLVYFRKKLSKLGDEKILLLFGLAVVSLLPYLGLGNLAERYGLLASSFFAILIIYILEKAVQMFFGKKKIAPVVLGILVFLLGFWYQKDLRQSTENWKKAGDTARKIIYAVKDNYRFFPKESTLYFSNIPIRFERSWIFPVGLPEALWFVYRDETIKVMMAKSAEEGLKTAENVPNSYVFSFEGNELKEVTLK
ncbi:O-antigen ligase family protein [Candidatus Gottesmanbacteria bacterium]|nr:O-antigen ligase family protein [Candidatus Gottesmanbacteria bacterium]